MLDVVYICRPGDNEELRYSLRSLSRVEHGRVWVIGGWPHWLTGVETVKASVVGGTKHDQTRLNMQVACVYNGPSDPFVLMHDDMYATAPTAFEVLHNGPLKARPARTGWASGQRATMKWLNAHVPGPHFSYDLHVPLIVHKEPMLHALSILSEVRHPQPHKRTLYGNIAALEGKYSRDPKVTSPRAELPTPWVSSSDATFTSCVLPLLGLDEPSIYEA